MDDVGKSKVCFMAASRTLMPIFHLFQEIIDENRENRRRAGDSNCMPKVAPLKVVILPIFVKMAKKRQRAGNSNWMQKVAPWRVAKKEKMAI